MIDKIWDYFHLFRYKISETDFGILGDKKVSESMWYDRTVRKANVISSYDNGSLDDI